MRSYFARRFLRYALLSILPMLLSFLILGFFVALRTGQDLELRAEQTLLNFESGFSYVNNNILYQNELLANNPEMMASLRQTLTRQEMALKDLIIFRSLRSVLQGIVNANAYIHSIYMDLDDSAYILTSENGILKKDRFFDSGWDQDDYPESDGSFIKERFMTHVSNSEGMEVITVYRRMTQEKGTIAINIDADVYRKEQSAYLASDAEVVYCINKSDEVVFSTDENYDETHHALLRSLLEQPRGASDNSKNRYFWTFRDSQLYFVHTSIYTPLGLTLVYVARSRALTSAFSAMLIPGAVILFASMALAFLLALYMTRRSHKKILIISGLFAKTEHSGLPESSVKVPKDEYDEIINRVIGVLQNSDFLTHQLTEREYQQRLAELFALQMQINPHFLFNTLQIIDLGLHDPATTNLESSEMIHALSDILQYALEDPAQTVTLRREIEYLKKYASIQKRRFAGKFIIYYEIPERLMDAQIPKLLLQPLVENSILYGVRHLKDRPGYIKVKATPSHRGGIRLAVLDNGLGMEIGKIESLRQSMINETELGIGIANINRRLLLRFGPESRLYIRSKATVGTSISFHIPIQPPESGERNQPNSAS
ncbi:MAG: histidine kinase [Oscillospiraceae bacterium]|jgi:two-component system sensor histidine kinase YesM|nr:histidine kinase [Oscillospiraceae bacterium]